MSSDCNKNINGCKIGLVITLIITVLLSGFCAVWTFIELKSEANGHEKELNDLTSKIKDYYSSCFPERTCSNQFGDDDPEGEGQPQKTASVMLEELMFKTRNLSTARTALQTKNDELRASKARIDGDIETLRKNFKQSFRKEMTNEAFLTLMKELDSLNQRIANYETEKRKIEREYQQLTNNIKTLELVINELFVSCGGRDTRLSNAEKIQFIKKILSQQKKNKIQELEAEKQGRGRQTPSTKKDAPKKMFHKPQIIILLIVHYAKPVVM